MADSSKLKTIAVAIVESGEKFLVGKRADGAPLAGYDEFPGGKVKADELPAEAAVRECLEETGVQVCVQRELQQVDHEYAHGRLHIHFFLCSVAADSPAQLHLPFRWVARSKLAELRFPEANQNVLQALVAE